MSISRISIIAIGALLLAARPAVAQTSAPSSPPSTAPAVDLGADRLTIGIGPAVAPSYTGSNDYIVVPGVAAQGQVSGFAFDTVGTSLYVDAIRGHGGVGWKPQFGPLIAARVGRTARIGDAQVSALGQLNTAWEVGVWGGIQRTGVVTSPYDTLSLGVSYQHDVGNAHHSYLIGPSISYATPLSHRDYVSLSLAADYIGRGFGRYYFDVSTAGAAASGLGRYDAANRAGWQDWSTSMLAAHSLTGDLTHGLAAFATGGYQRVLGRYARSPIVADAGSCGQWTGAAGLAYTF